MRKTVTALLVSYAKGVAKTAYD